MTYKTKEVFSFRTLVLKIGDYFKIHSINHWDWREGAKETLNPFPAILHTLDDIWISNDSVRKDIGIVNNRLQTTKKITLWDKLQLTFNVVIRPVLFNFYWRYGNGLGDYGHTKFKWLTLSYYRDHTCWAGDRFQHSWKSKKSLFSKYWKNYDHRYWKHCSHGTWERELNEDIYYSELDQLREGVYNDE